MIVMNACPIMVCVHKNIQWMGVNQHCRDCGAIPHESQTLPRTRLEDRTEDWNNLELDNAPRR